MAPTRDDAHERVEQLIVLTQRLTAVMLAEAEAFEAHRPRDALAGAQETARLANLYRHESVRLRGDPTLISTAPGEARRRLIETTRAFDAVLARHGRAVEAAKTITEGLVHAIAEEVVAQNKPPAGYGAAGQAYGGAATSITLNQRA